MVGDLATATEAVFSTADGEPVFVTYDPTCASDGDNIFETIWYDAFGCNSIEDGGVRSLQLIAWNARIVR